jgi:hypothetical protein
MKRSRMLLKLGTLSLFVMLSVVSGPVAAADYFIQATYFENVNVGFNDFIPEYYDNTNSINGSVMPNRDMTSQDTGTGAGAVGTKALNVSGSAPNRTKKEALYNLLRQKNQNGTDWEKMGSAFIVHTMIDRPWGSGGRNIPVNDPEWAELRARLVENDDVVMDRYYYARTNNTSGMLVNGGRYDAVRYVYSDAVLVDAWVFTVDGSPVYALEIICGNPLGALAGLPPAQYSLTPSVSLDKTIIEPDETVTVTNTVRNGSNVRTEETDWRLTKIEYRPGTDLDNNDTRGRDNGSEPCDTFPQGGRSVPCRTEQRSSREIFNARSTKTYAPEFEYVAPVGTPVGTKICFTVSVSRPTRDPSPSWRHSTLRCVIVGKKPKIQVWGGDIRVGGAIDTSTSTFSSLRSTYGSWGEYGALSNESNSGFASGAGLNDGNTNRGQGRWSDLTFANSNTACAFGCYGFSSYAPSLTGQFTSTPSSPLPTGTPNLADLASGTYRATNRTIAGGSISPGKTIIIVATGRITIAGDITYNDGPYTSLSDIPQVVIKAAEINIAGSVSNVDAWLLATTDDGDGTINTCSDVGPTVRLTVDMCNRPLKINGPIVTDRLYLRRTAGSAGGPTTIDDPAEIFNLRADAYLWGNNYGGGNGKVQTVHTKELPPRF